MTLGSPPCRYELGGVAERETDTTVSETTRLFHTEPVGGTEKVFVMTVFILMQVMIMDDTITITSCFVGVMEKHRRKISMTSSQCIIDIKD